MRFKISSQIKTSSQINNKLKSHRRAHDQRTSFDGFLLKVAIVPLMLSLIGCNEPTAEQAQEKVEQEQVQKQGYANLVAMPVIADYALPFAKMNIVSTSKSLLLRVRINGLMLLLKRKPPI